eukprot:6212361-Pleurochrysis_carterae.AAC.3
MAEKRREREVTLSERRAKRAQLHTAYEEAARNVIVEEGVIRGVRKKYESQMEQRRQARQISKKLRAKRRATEGKREDKAREAREDRRHQAARKRVQQEEKGREGEVRKRRSGKEVTGVQGQGTQGVQTPAGRTRERVQTRSTSHSSRSPLETPEGATDVSIILASERGLPTEGEIFAHLTRLLGVNSTTGAEWDIKVSPEGADQALFIKGYKLTLPEECLQEEGLMGPLAKNEIHTERWGVLQIAEWRSEQDKAKLGCVARMRGRGGPQASTRVMELPAVAGGFFNVTRPEGSEAMRRQIQEVLRKAGEELTDRDTEKEREDLRGVTVSSVQQLYVKVRGMRTCAATNKCAFGYTTPSGEELSWDPTKFTIHAGYHKRSHKVKADTASTYHTARGALILNEQGK